MVRVNKNKEPLISIVIPVYNGSDYMREAIDSALAQTYQNFEIIVVDDGSVDDTGKIAESYGEKIRYYKKENGGVASALNLGLKEMRGVYFSWLSHDDAYYPDKLEKQVNFLISQKDKDVVLYGDYALMNENSHVFQNIIFNHEMLANKPEYALLRGSINGNTLLIPKKAFDDCGDFDEKLRTTQDYAKWYEMSKTYKFVHVPEVLAKYRVHENQDTKKNPKFVTEGEQLWNKMIGALTSEDRIRLEGSDLNFYARMWLFLKGTPYVKTIKFVEDKLCESVQAAKKDKQLIAFVSHSSGNSGAERAMLNEIDKLLEKDVLVHVTLPSPGPLEKELEKRGVFYSIGKIRSAIKSRWTVQNDVKKEIISNTGQLAELYRIIQPDVVISIASVIFEGAFAAKLAGIPHIWNISEYGVREHGIRFLIPEGARMDLINNYSEKVLFPSQTIREHFLGKIALKKTDVLPPISADEVLNDKKIDSQVFEKNDSLKLVIAGNVVEGKGQRDAVLAVAELQRRGVDVSLVMVGPYRRTKYFREIQRIINKNRMKNVKILPEVESVIPIFRAADIVLMCSVFESFGRVTAEAMLCEKPVIGADSGATPELVKDGVTGFLYQPGDYRELAARIEHFVNHKTDIQKFGKNGARIIKGKLDDKKNKQLVDIISGLGDVKIKGSEDEIIKDIKRILALDDKNSFPKKAVEKVLRKTYAQVPRLKRLRDKLRRK
jgi:glycosyltransferase involved in cell wall biosynthesis